MSPTVLIIKVEGAGWHDGHNVYFNDMFAYYRRYDGSSASEVEEEAVKAIAELVREKLGHPEHEPDEW